MRSLKIDVDLMVRRDDVIRDGGFERMLPTYMRAMRDKASARAAEVNGLLRVTSQPEFVVSEGMRPIIGDVFLMATRWQVDVPENARIDIER